MVLSLVHNTCQNGKLESGLKLQLGNSILVVSPKLDIAYFLLLIIRMCLMNDSIVKLTIFRCILQVDATIPNERNQQGGTQHAVLTSKTTILTTSVELNP